MAMGVVIAVLAPGVLRVDWGEDRVQSVTATLRDRFGLRLSPGARDMDALIVDRIRPEPALVLLAGIGRITRGAPTPVRQRIADVLTVR